MPLVTMTTTLSARSSLTARLPLPLAASLALALAACTGGGAVSSGPQPPKRISGVPSVRPPMRPAPRDARLQMAPGLEGVIGANQSQLVRMFGEPRLDVWEGDARKLQCSGTACVLDVFLYPSTTSKELHASYVDARRSSDGQDVDRGACVAALRGK